MTVLCTAGAVVLGGNVRERPQLNLNLGLGTNCDFRIVGYVLFHVPLK